MRRALVIGAGGQIGTELTIRLAKELGAENVIASDLNAPKISENTSISALKLDVLDQVRLKQIVLDYEISEVYHLAATLSATAEKNPGFSWHLNMQSLLNVLDLAKEELIQKVFWPSSVAVFGPGSPKTNTPQNTFMNPNTVYGISKSAGENWCNYYFEKYNVDVRSLRFPGLLGYKFSILPQFDKSVLSQILGHACISHFIINKTFYRFIILVKKSFILRDRQYSIQFFFHGNARLKYVQMTFQSNHFELNIRCLNYLLLL